MSLIYSTGWQQETMGFSPTGSIASAADGGGGLVVITTSSAHGLSNGTIVTQSGTTDYDGVFAISAVTDTTYTITVTWNVTRTGTWVVRGRNMQNILDLGQIQLYSGAASAAADNAITATLLVTILNGGVGLNFGEPVAGKIGIKSGETWSGVAVADGASSFFRYTIKSVDDGGSTTTQIRIQGNVGTSSTSDLVLPSTAISSGATQTIDQFFLTNPAS